MKRTNKSKTLFDYSLSITGDKSETVIMVKPKLADNGEFIEYQYIKTRSDHYENILNSTSPITIHDLFEVLLLPNTFENQVIKRLLFEKALAQNIDIDTQIGRDNLTLLHRTCSWNYYDLTKLLLENWANPNIQNENNDTPLHIIAKNKSIGTTINLAKLLLNYGANTELADVYGWIPIQSATRRGHTDLVKLLLQYGADSNVVILEGNYCRGKNIIELVPDNKPELKALLKIIKACKENNFDILDDSVTTANIIEFLDWQISIKPQYTNSNAKACFKYHHELQNFKKFLETKQELNNQEIQKLNDSLDSYINLKDLLISQIIENYELYQPNILSPDLTEQLKNCWLKLGGDIYGTVNKINLIDN